jgi:putative tryptophan/tyrosine transport system substrate-binding protein
MRPCRVGTAVVLLASIVVALAPSAFPASARPARRPYRIGVLNDARAANHPTVDGLKAGLREAGLQDGRDVAFDIKPTDGNPEQMLGIAAAMVKAGVDVIFTSGEGATLTAKAATQEIPIVFTLVGDPVAAGVVRSLAQPEGNVTGISSLTTDLVPKRLEALKTLAPWLRRVWAISHGSDPASTAALAKALEVSPRFGLEIAPRTVRTASELEQFLGGLRPGAALRRGDALLVPDIAAMDISALLLETSLAHRIPAVFSSELWVSHGGLVSYGADYRAQGAQAARLVWKILRGTLPRDLPVEGADRVILAVNLKTVESFGLVAPRQILFRADIIRR